MFKVTNRQENYTPKEYKFLLITYSDEAEIERLLDELWSLDDFELLKIPMESLIQQRYVAITGDSFKPRVRNAAKTDFKQIVIYHYQLSVCEQNGETAFQMEPNLDKWSKLA